MDMAQRSASERRPIPEAGAAGPAPPPERLPVRSLTELAVETIRDRILDLTLRPGLRIDQKLLMERFRLSRTPARQARNRLSPQGLRRSQANKGPPVPPPGARQGDQS